MTVLTMAYRRKMLSDIVFRTHLDVFRRALLGDPPPRVEPMTVRLQPGARAVRAKLGASPPAKAAWLHDTMVTPEGLFTPRRVPQGVLNAFGYYQATMGNVFDGYIDEICLVLVDDIMILGETPETLLKRLWAISDRPLERGVFVAAHKAVFFRKEMERCGQILSGQTVSHDPRRTDGLSELCRPETTGEPMQVRQAIDWMRTSLPELAELDAPLEGLREDRTRLPPDHGVVGGRLQQLPPCLVQCPLYGR